MGWWACPWPSSYSATLQPRRALWSQGRAAVAHVSTAPCNLDKCPPGKGWAAWAAS